MEGDWGLEKREFEGRTQSSGKGRQRRKALKVVFLFLDL
jgi:hypothetical protein